MYQVWRCAYGIPATIGVNGMLWEHGLAGHETKMLAEFRRKQDAIDACNALECRGTVTRYFTSDVVHDNGKPPASRLIDHRPDPSIPVRAPRDLAAYGLPTEKP